MKKLTFIMAAMLALVLSACGGENNEPAFPDQELKVGDIFNISNGETGWYSDNDKIASVNGTVVTANKVGEVKIRNNKHFFRVNVTPRYTYITDPYLAWGGSKAMVKYSVKAPFASETDNSIEFGPLGNETSTTYYFGTNGLARVLVNISSGKVSEAEILKFLNERYTQIGTGSGQGEQLIGYKSPDDKTSITFTKYISPSPLAGTMTISYLKF
ncbi:MAG: hypothetical protein KBT13_11700 [Bacteroidales bacterium]|uniref:hypothetical protein n=1 Tax=Sodaliphilus sp. TaxID=2815818 RepID=UPI001B4AFA1E|nr:hypothetical protein [Candidatus Sodaliphilus limicaballi]